MHCPTQGVRDKVKKPLAKFEPLPKHGAGLQGLFVLPAVEFPAAEYFDLLVSFLSTSTPSAIGCSPRYRPRLLF